MSRLLKTSVDLPSFPFKVRHDDNILLMGSCFVEHIGDFFKNSFVSCCLNPTGINFNPISIAKTINHVVQCSEFSSNDLIKSPKGHVHLDFHGSFASDEEEKLLFDLNQTIKNANEFIKKAELLIISLGTSHVYYHLEKQQIANNCHKINQSQFEKRLIDNKQSTSALFTAIQSLKKINKNLKIILTVSPVRHIKDGLQANSISKAHLRLCCENLCDTIENCYYFPSYELLIDELRDYRFYNEDMIHPSKLAVDLIIEKFIDLTFAEKEIEILHQCNKVRRVLNHIPIQKAIEPQLEFYNKTLNSIKTLKLQYPYIDIAQEKADIEQKINSIINSNKINVVQ